MRGEKLSLINSWFIFKDAVVISDYVAWDIRMINE
jgi:hypothetical protein